MCVCVCVYVCCIDDWIFKCFIFVLQGGVGRLAEIIVGFALGLELSTLASVCSGQFASAHEKLGRKHPQNGLKGSHIGPELFTGLMGDGWIFIRHTPFTVG